MTHFPRLFCIGHNYHAHIEELGSTPLAEPTVFIKPMTALVEGECIPQSPQYRLEHEVEVVVRLKSGGKNIPIELAYSHIDALALGLDLTLRDLQKSLKAKGLPWERAKAFDGSATIGPFTEVNEALDLNAIEFACTVNSEERQVGQTKMMIYSIDQLIANLSSTWELAAGDLIFTGTPAGVGALLSGDTVSLSSDVLTDCQWVVD